MCGIVGFVSAQEPADEARVRAMADTLVHRGPDDGGVFVDGAVGLGFRRLSIIDVSGGHQPMTAAHATIVFNGEIYDFAAVRAQLEQRGHTFTTRSDTEVLLRGYLEWGVGVFERVHGMFAVALWDAKARRLVLARDRFGKKPLYVTHGPFGLVFGSELKAVLRHPSVPRALNGAAVRRYLAFDCVPTPDCIIDGVRKLPAGHVATWENGRLTETPFYRVPDAPPHSVFEQLPSSIDAACNRLREELTGAVRRRLVSDVPLGIFLSGGVDSSAVTALAAREVPRGTLKTFSIAFAEASFDESRFARLAAKHLGTDHHEETLSAEACLDLVPKVADQLDEPFADPSYVPTYLLSAFTRRHVTVALGGDGADELFAGYDSFLAHPLGVAFGGVPREVWESVRGLTGLLPRSGGYMSFDFRASQLLAGLGRPAHHRHQAWISSFTPESMQVLLTPKWKSLGDPVADVYAPLDSFVAGRTETGVELAERLYLHFYLKDDILVKVDRASMAASLEVRSPFLDTRVVELAGSLPFSLKMRGLKRKWLLKRALEPLLPAEILYRQKHGFALPVAAWLKGPLRPLVEDVLSERRLADAGVFEPAVVRRLVTEHLSGRADHRKALWSVLMFELWRNRWLSGERR
jgi:asparagine synthase (glutamine-hydrolysing)